MTPFLMANGPERTQDTVSQAPSEYETSRFG